MDKTSPKIFRRKKRSGDFCCVPGCANQRSETRSAEPHVSYHRFPDEARSLKRRSLWVGAVNRGDGWLPRQWNRVCSAHFVDNKPSKDPASESYCPTLFSFNSNHPTRKTPMPEKDERFREGLTSKMCQQLMMQSNSNITTTDINITNGLLPKVHTPQPVDHDYIAAQNGPTLEENLKSVDAHQDVH